jgi:hypothetical protein
MFGTAEAVPFPILVAARIIAVRFPILVAARITAVPFPIVVAARIIAVPFPIVVAARIIAVPFPILVAARIIAVRFPVLVAARMIAVPFPILVAARIIAVPFPILVAARMIAVPFPVLVAARITAVPFPVRRVAARLQPHEIGSWFKSINRGAEVDAAAARFYVLAGARVQFGQWDGREAHASGFGGFKKCVAEDHAGHRNRETVGVFIERADEDRLPETADGLIGLAV